MGSKSILILGIVILFLINVLAIHDYVNNHYYSVQTNHELKPIVIKKETKHKEKITLPIVKTVVKPVVKKEPVDNISKYKAIYKSNLNKEYEETKKILSKNSDIKSTKKIKVKKTENEINALITIDFNIEQKYENNSPVIKKVLSKFDKNKKIIIEIYQYSLKIQDYLKNIKTNLVDKGVDIDDISTIYKKDKDRKNKIKLLLVKKD